MLFGLFKIAGHSMLPKLKPNDRVLVSSIPYFFSEPRKSDVVMFKYQGKIMIKRINKISSDKILTRGDNTLDSLKIKPIGREDILGKVVFILNT